MNPLEKTFGRHKVLLPVIHATDIWQVRENIDVAHQAGADGVFLINHAMGYPELVEIYHIVKKEFPRLWIGLNFLGVGSDRIPELVKETEVDGLWRDDAGLREDLMNPAVHAEEFWESLGKRRHPPIWDGLYFGGVAFKYQRKVNDLEKVAAASVGLMEVITTSGDATGSPPDIGKILRMRQAIGDWPLAIASGITPENVEPYLTPCDAFLVSTGISYDEVMLNPFRTKEMVDVIRGHRA
ncbi:MAG: adenine phosphoribosyltransferase [Candidatus Moranbacteria bacterium]|nr:adenine phosphoribosyltransferase [Candidatus Moranbacteria bacterium]